MQVVNVAAVSALVLSGLATAATLTANTPGSLFVCEPGLLSWTGGVAPYYPRINTAGSTTSTIEELSETSDLNVTWTVNLDEGDTFTLAVADSTGAEAYSAVSPSIGAGTTTSCLNSTSSTTTSTSDSSTSSTASSSTAASDASTTSSDSSSTKASSSTSTTKSSTSTTSSSSSTSTTASSDGAVTLRGFSAVVAGAVGVVVAAII